MSESIFSVRVIDEWNSLPGSVIHSNIVNTLELKLTAYSFFPVVSHPSCRWFVELS